MSKQTVTRSARRTEMYSLAENFLFGDAEVPEVFRKEFYTYMDEHFARLQCCVLWGRDLELVALIAKYNLPPIDKKEIIMEGDWIKGSTDYFAEPFKNLDNKHKTSAKPTIRRQYL